VYCLKIGVDDVNRLLLDDVNRLLFLFFNFAVPTYSSSCLTIWAKREKGCFCVWSFYVYNVCVCVCVCVCLHVCVLACVRVCGN